MPVGGGECPFEQGDDAIAGVPGRGDELDEAALVDVGGEAGWRDHDVETQQRIGVAAEGDDADRAFGGDAEEAPGGALVVEDQPGDVAVDELEQDVQAEGGLAAAASAEDADVLGELGLGEAEVAEWVAAVEDAAEADGAVGLVGCGRVEQDAALGGGPSGEQLGDDLDLVLLGAVGGEPGVLEGGGAGAQDGLEGLEVGAGAAAR